MKKILITGFQPFANLNINPSLEILKKLPDIIEDKLIVKREVCVVFDKCFSAIENDLAKDKFDYVVALGVAQNRKILTLEKYAHNIKKCNIKDNENVSFINEEPIDVNGKYILETSFNLVKIVESLNVNKKLAEISLSAGTYVCNNLYYLLLENENKYGYKSLFIHVPDENNLAIEEAQEIIIKTINLLAN